MSAKIKSKFNGPKESPGFLLWQVSSAWRRSLDSVLQQYELTHVQFVILASIGWLTREGGVASQIDLARHARLDVAMTSQVIRALEKRHFLERKQLSGNERSKFCFLTEEGGLLIRKAFPAIEDADISFFERLSTCDTRALCRIMNNLIEGHV